MNPLTRLAKKTYRQARAGARRGAHLLHRKTRKFLRSIRATHGAGYGFALLCVKREPYAIMAIENINSLHFLNPRHSFVIYADDICESVLAENMRRFDYPEKVRVVNAYGSADKPWQRYKIETIIDSSRKGLIFTDADGIWHDDPKIGREEVTLLVLAYPIRSNAIETKVCEHLFSDIGAGAFDHYVTGFVSIPAKLMTDGLADDMRKRTDALLDDPFSFLELEKDRENIRRLSEELGMNIALQSNGLSIDTLKKSDGPKDRNILQSLYYGCANEITS